MHAKPDHHAVVQFGSTAADGERQPGDRLAVGIGEAANGALADAFTERGDDFNLLVARKDIHGGPNPTCWGNRAAESENRPVLRYIALSGHFLRGRNPEVDDPGPPLLPTATVPLNNGAGSQVRTDVSGMYPPRPYR